MNKKDLTKTELELLETVDPIKELLEYNLGRYDYHISKAEKILKRCRNIVRSRENLKEASK